MENEMDPTERNIFKLQVKEQVPKIEMTKENSPKWWIDPITWDDPIARGLLITGYALFLVFIVLTCYLVYLIKITG